MTGMEPQQDGAGDGAEYHVNYRGPTYLADVWHLCGAYDNLAEARAGFAARLVADLTAGERIGCEWRLVAVRDALIVEVHDHVRLTARGVPTVLEDRRQPQGGT